MILKLNFKVKFIGLEEKFVLIAFIKIMHSSNGKGDKMPFAQQTFVLQETVFKCPSCLHNFMSRVITFFILCSLLKY